MGASIQGTFSKNVTHVFAVDTNSLLKKVDHQRLIRSKAVSFGPLYLSLHIVQL